LFEREACPGGRLASHRFEGLCFDHGVQYFTIQDARFESIVRAWHAAGVVSRWSARTMVLTGRGHGETVDAAPRFVGVPNMEAVAIHMARGLDIRPGVEVTGLHRRSGRWLLRGRDGVELDEGGFDLVVVATPPPIAAQLLGDSSELARRAGTVSWDPCWAVMLALARPSGIDFDAAFVSDDPILGWAARESGKPGRAPLKGAVESWILHAHPAWSRTYLELDPSDASRWVLRAFAARVGRPLAQAAATSQRWRLALPVNPLPESFLLDEQQGIGLIGDWCGGPRVEGAYRSGIELAQAIAS
jgi:hypothetical protein